MLCPHCHQEISAGSKFCNFCGKPIPQEVFCAKCGAKLPQGSRFCHLCGEAVNAVPAPDAEEEKRAAAERRCRRGDLRGQRDVEHGGRRVPVPQEEGRLSAERIELAT